MNSQLTKSPNSYLSWWKMKLSAQWATCSGLHLSMPCSDPFLLSGMLPSCSPPIPAMEILFIFEAQVSSRLLYNGLFDYPSCFQQVIIPSTIAQHCHAGISLFWIHSVLISVSSLTSVGTWWWLIVVHFCVLHKALHRGGTPFGCSVGFTHRSPDWVNKKSSMSGLINFWHSSLFAK